MSSTYSAIWHNLLVNGYVKSAQNEYEFFMDIPNELIDLIYTFYPRIRRINEDLFNKSQFILLNDNKTIKGKGNCSSYICYAECEQHDGYGTGIHYFSVKASIKPYVNIYLINTIIIYQIYIYTQWLLSIHWNYK